MSRYSALKAIINQDITTNGQGDITGAILNQVLKDMVGSLGAYFQFGGIATPTTNPGNPDQRVFYIATIAGTYTNFGSLTVPNGISVLKFDESWSLETLDLSVYINNVVANGIVVDMIQDATQLNAIPALDGKIYSNYNAGDIFYMEDNDVRKYRVALTAGTADAEHPVTISPANFYYALNSADALNLSLTLKTVSTEQQSLSSEQKTQARTNIAAVGYDQQLLSAEQQVRVQNNVFAKAYSSDASVHSGLGKVYLQKNNGSLTQAMINTANTVYVIQYDYTLAADITIPAGCTLEFDGGSISGSYTLTGNGTVIKADLTKIFGKELVIAGSWNVANVYSDWFEHVANENNTKQLQSIFTLANDNVVNNVYLNDASYNLDGYDTVNDTPFVIAIPSNTNVYNKATIQILNTEQRQSFPISVLRKENIKWQGGSIIGFASAQSDSEHRHGFSLRGGKNVEVSNVIISRFCGDSINLQYGSNNIHNENVYIHDVVCDYSNRQGISVEDGIGVIIDNCAISNIGQIKHTSPAAGIDIEPAYYDEARFVNIVIKNVTITNTYGARLMFYLYNHQQAADITIENLVCDGAIFPTVIPASVNVTIKNSQFRIYGGSSVITHSRNIHCIDCTISGINVENNVVLHGFVFENCQFLSDINIASVDTSNIQFKNCQLLSVSTASNDMYFDSCLFKGTLGQLIVITGKYFRNCTIENNEYVRLFCSDDTVLDNCSIIVSQAAPRSYGAVTLYARNTNTPKVTFNNCTIKCPDDVQMIMRDTTANTDLVVNFNGGYYPQFTEAVANAAHLDIRYTEGFGFFNKTLARNVSVSHVPGSTIIRQQVKRDTARHVFIPNTLVEGKQYIASSSWATSSPQYFAFAKENNVESEMVNIINGPTQKTSVEFEALSASEYPYLYFDCNYPDLYFTISELVNSWIGEDGYTAVITSGTTAERPTDKLTLQDVGFRYFDKTLSKPIYLIVNNNTKSWVDATGAAA